MRLTSQRRSAVFRDKDVCVVRAACSDVAQFLQESLRCGASCSFPPPQLLLLRGELIELAQLPDTTPRKGAQRDTILREQTEPGNGWVLAAASRQQRGNDGARTRRRTIYEEQTGLRQRGKSYDRGSTVLRRKTRVSESNLPTFVSPLASRHSIKKNVTMAKGHTDSLFLQKAD